MSLVGRARCAASAGFRSMVREMLAEELREIDGLVEKITGE